MQANEKKNEKKEIEEQEESLFMFKLFVRKVCAAWSSS